MKTSELTGIALDWAVTSIEAPEALRYGIEDWREQRRCALDSMRCFLYRWSSNWAQGWPIIEREKLQINPHFPSAGYAHPEGLWEWESYVLGPTNIDDNFEQHGPTPLVAAMRCFVASKLGDEVEVPGELL